MEKRKWHNSDIQTSLLGFGAMRFVTKDGKVVEDLALDLIDYAYKNGVNYFDTAAPYLGGQSEIVLGKALKRYPRDSFYLADKLTTQMLESGDKVLDFIKEQLHALQTDYIDFYLLHAMGRERFEYVQQNKIMEQLEEAKSMGLIRNIGFSFHDDYDAFKWILDSYPWDFCQIQLNYMDQDIQQGIKGYYDLLSRNIPVVIMEPIKGGKLAKFHERAEEILTKKEPNKSIASWAMRWIGSFEGVKVVLSGMNQLDQLQDNIETYTNFKPLNDEEMAIVDVVSKELNSITEVNCTDCKYCLPCSVGVNIPGNFKIFNDFAMYKNEGGSKWEYSMLEKASADASLCITCNECVPKCPQHIMIPEELSRMLDTMAFLRK